MINLLKNLKFKLKKIRLGPILKWSVLLSVISIFFVFYLNQIHNEMLIERFNKKIAEVDFISNLSTSLIERYDDWETKHEYYTDMLVETATLINNAVSSHVCFWDHELNNVYHTDEYHHTMKEKYIDVINSSRSGTFKLKEQWTDRDLLDDKAHQQISVYFRWLPENVPHKKQYLMTIVVDEKNTADIRSGKQFIYVSIALLAFLLINIGIFEALVRNWKIQKGLIKKE